MKKICLLCLMLMCSMASIAQDFEITSVESLPNDFSAREEMKTDHNDRQCALLRIATQSIAPEQRELFTFKTDLGSEIVERATRNGEIWLWVSPGLKYLRIMHRDMGQYELHLLDHVSRVEALHTYKVTIRGTEQGKDRITQQYLMFQIMPANALLEVDGQLWSVDADGTAMKYVDFGTYSYRVMASDYFTETGNVIVDDPENTKVVPVSLKPNFAEITLTVDADAEIWVNNVKKGTRTWTGPLGNGTYKIECKQANHETSMVSKEITPAMNGQTITLPAPTPIYGSLNIESTPNLATIYIDGKEVGKTPKSIPQIIIGQHEIKLLKDGCVEHIETIIIRKDERKQLSATLSRGKEIQFTCHVLNAQLEIDGEKVNSANGSYSLSYGIHSVKAMADDYQEYDATINVTESTQNHNILMKSIVRAPEGALPNKFSVALDKQVYFSKGNLQYQASTNKWRFAEHQWDIIGGSNSFISRSYNGWIDLFGWGTGNNPTNTSTSQWDYSGFYDWGSRYDGTWYTLSKDEWEYLVDKRNTTSGIRYAKATVNGVCGVILLPDDWNSDTYSLNRTNNSEANFNSNSINSSQWMIFENAGAVFLPSAGDRIGTMARLNMGSEHQGYYWSSSFCERNSSYSSAYVLEFNEHWLNASFFNTYNCRTGLSVRLVCPAEE